ncbi:MAG: hypothetical protein WBB74_05045 [Gaiellaceae bacterium]
MGERRAVRLVRVAFLAAVATPAVTLLAGCGGHHGSSARASPVAREHALVIETLDGDTGQGVHGAAVRIGNRQDHTDRKGALVVDGAGGALSVSVSAPRYSSRTLRLSSQHGRR